MALVLTDTDIHGILSSGGGLTITTAGRTFQALCSIAASAKRGNARLTLRVASVLSASELMSIAAQAPGLVIFDLT